MLALGPATRQSGVTATPRSDDSRGDHARRLLLVFDLLDHAVELRPSHTVSGEGSLSRAKLETEPTTRLEKARRVRKCAGYDVEPERTPIERHTRLVLCDLA